MCERERGVRERGVREKSVREREREREKRWNGKERIRLVLYYTVIISF